MKVITFMLMFSILFFCACSTTSRLSGGRLTYEKINYYTEDKDVSIILMDGLQIDINGPIVNKDSTIWTNPYNSSLDGVPTISPDGQWVAFASNREGGWAVFVAPISGGSVQKLFDFPKPNPWGTGDQDWTNERMSWSPS